MAESKNALVEKLIKLISNEVSKIPDHRGLNNHQKISLHDAIMCGLAVMHLKYPSLLKFDQDCARDKENLHNLASLYRIKQVLSDTHLRSLLDPIKPTHFRKIFTTLFSYVQRSKRLKQFEFLDEGYLVPIDGTGHFASGKIHCKECCIKKANSKNPQYYHQLLAACIVKPGKKEVIPLMPEPITQQIEASKNDCEKAALKRLLADISREHPHLQLVLNFDDLYSDGPTIKLISSYGYHFIMVAKSTSHSFLYQTFTALDKEKKVTDFQFTDEEGYQHTFKFVNGVAINHSHPDLLVNCLQYIEISPKGKSYSNTWVTDINLTKENVEKVMRGGRARWKIENETFNTLKNLGYNLEHSYGHGKQHLATNFAHLTFIAFLIDQIEQMTCPLFQKALLASKSKKALWHSIRGLFDWFIIDSWTEMMVAIIEKKSTTIKHIVFDTS